MSEYISREEMIDAVDHLHIIPSIDGTGKPTPTEDFRVQFVGTVLKVKSADVAPVETLKAEIYKLKHQSEQSFGNHDYYVGYISALSTVEGILAAMREE